MQDRSGDGRTGHRTVAVSASVVGMAGLRGLRRGSGGIAVCGTWLSMRCSLEAVVLVQHAVQQHVLPLLGRGLEGGRRWGEG